MAFANVRFLPKHASIFDDRSAYGLRDPWVETPAISSSSEASASLADDNVVDDLVGRRWRSGGNFVVIYGGNDVVDFAEKQLVSDWDMEAEGTSAWTAGSGVTLSKDTAVRYQGSRSLKVELSGASMGYFSQNLAGWTAGKQYRFSGWYRCGSTGRGQFVVDCRLTGTTGDVILLNSGDLTAKGWTSYTGLFVVPADASQLRVLVYIRDDGGTVYYDAVQVVSEEVHAQLDADSYTASGLAAEIKSKMEAASGVGATYTVSYSTTTGKWTISTNQAWLSLFFATGENAATNPNRRNDPTAEDAASLLGFRQHPSSGGGSGGASTYGADLEGAASYTGDFSACHTEEWVKFAFSLVQPINCVGLFGHNLSEDAVVTFEAHIIDDFGPAAEGAGTIPFSQAMTWHKEGMALFAGGLSYSGSQGTYRYFLVRIRDPENPGLYVELGRVIGGCYTEPERNFLWGYAKRRVDTSLHFVTEGTQRLTKRKKQVRYLDVTFEGTEEDFEALDEMFRTIGNADPLMLALGDADPDAPPFYGYLSGEWAPERAFMDRYNCSLSVEEAA